MIDTEARNKYAEILRHFAAGRMTNFEYEEAYDSIKTTDRAIRAIGKQVWFLYDEMGEHRLTKDYKLIPDDRRRLTQAILFLHTDNELEWPDMPMSSGCYLYLIAGLFGISLITSYEFYIKTIGNLYFVLFFTGILLCLLLFTEGFFPKFRPIVEWIHKPIMRLAEIIDKPREAKLLGPLADKIDLWPFARESDLEEACRQPRFLCGKL